MVPQRDSFTSKFGVIAAAAGSAIGLGNIWRFPYVAGENGGGAFLFVYIGFIILIGIPVMLSELSIGRAAQQNPFGAFKKLAPKTYWQVIGFMGVIAAFVILSFYATVAGWTLHYLYSSVLDSFAGQSPQQLEQTFTDFKAGTFMPVLWQVVFMVLTAFIVMAGIKDGIEKYTKVLMPILLVLILVLIVRSLTLPGAMKGLEFLFAPDFSKITGEVILEALGQAFFSLSIGMGTLITYGSYIRKDNNLVNTAVSVSMSDTLIAILAGVAIFPAVFAFNIEPSSGPGLVFITLPNIFEQMPGGYFFSLMFFLLLSVAALTSSISVLEVVVAYFSEELKMTRKKATLLASGAITLTGLLSTMSWGALSEVTLTLGSAAETDVGGGSTTLTIFDIFDFISANILLPLGGLFIVLFVGWKWKKEHFAKEISNENTFKTPYIGLMMFILKFLAPLAIAIVFLRGVGLF